MNARCRFAGFTAFAFLPLIAGAQIVRCTDPSGAVTYQQAPCPAQARQAEVAPPPVPSAEEAHAARLRSGRMVAEVAMREQAESAALAARQASFAAGRREQAERCQAARDRADLAGAFLISESDVLQSWAMRRIAQERRIIDSNGCRFVQY